ATADCWFLQGTPRSWSRQSPGCLPTATSLAGLAMPRDSGRGSISAARRWCDASRTSTRTWRDAGPPDSWFRRGSQNRAAGRAAAKRTLVLDDTVQPFAVGGDSDEIQVVLLATLPVGFRPLQCVLRLADVEASRPAGSPATKAAGPPVDAVPGRAPLSHAATTALAAASPGVGARPARHPGDRV